MMLLSPFGLAIHVSARTFLIIYRLGLHASFKGHEVAWTRTYGWVMG
jgi:hypothetical protein